MRRFVFGAFVLFLLLALVPSPRAGAQTIDSSAVPQLGAVTAAGTAPFELTDGGEMGRGHLGPRMRDRMQAMMGAINRACPCKGPLPDPTGAEAPRAWTDHAEYVQCVTDKVAEMAGGKLPQEVQDRIVERAEKSKIGEPGHVCPRRPVVDHLRACFVAVREVHRVCTCEGKVTVGADGQKTVTPWASHEEYVACVDETIPDDAPEACADMIKHRAEKSPIGTDGFTCPARPREDRPERP